MTGNSGTIPSGAFVLSVRSVELPVASGHFDLAVETWEADMKNLLAMLSGFVLTLTMFGGGALSAIYVIAAEPPPGRPLDLHTSALWTNKAVRVNAASQSLQRLPGRSAPQQSRPEPARAPRSVDTTTTAAIAASPPAVAINASHIEWCSRHYRSYDPGDNSYNAYSGIRRVCVSPYSDDPASDKAPRKMGSSPEMPELVSAAEAGEINSYDVNFEHVRSCFDRYRSYRPEDNTYQPYGGGPRQQCQ
jgi:hypothetical protein